jgi:TP901 family phage tail tape measure protein
VSTDDLQTALSKSAAAMATAGNSFEETIALVEAGTAIMQGQAGTVGNGLRTIAINIASLATESDEFVAANGKVNISLKNERGEIRSTYEILNDLAKNWNNLSTAEQNSIAVTLAGKHKYKSLVLPALNLFNCSKCLITL